LKRPISWDSLTFLAGAAFLADCLDGVFAMVDDWFYIITTTVIVVLCFSRSMMLKIVSCLFYYYYCLCFVYGRGGENEWSVDDDAHSLLLPVVNQQRQETRERKSWRKDRLYFCPEASWPVSVVLLVILVRFFRRGADCVND
jgi:Ca2+/Na+ antiporter